MRPESSLVLLGSIRPKRLGGRDAESCYKEHSGRDEAGSIAPRRIAKPLSPPLCIVDMVRLFLARVAECGFHSSGIS
jgi:hypothetical protein